MESVFRGNLFRPPVAGARPLSWQARRASGGQQPTGRSLPTSPGRADSVTSGGSQRRIFGTSRSLTLKKGDIGPDLGRHVQGHTASEISGEEKKGGAEFVPGSCWGF